MRLDPGVVDDLREGAADPAMAGPLGLGLTRMLAHPTLGLVLDAWYDADGIPRGNAGAIVNGAGGVPPVEDEGGGE